MYIWVGINVDNQLNTIKSKAMEIESQIGFTNSNFTLPLHISLKMSFAIEENMLANVIESISDFYDGLPIMNISVDKIEKHDNIIWLKMSDNTMLNNVHDQLNDLLMDKYGIGLHMYDKDYLFHTTLFMDDDKEKINQAYQQIKNVEIPSVLIANEFLIGISYSGKLGTYRVIKTITK